MNRCALNGMLAILCLLATAAAVPAGSLPQSSIKPGAVRKDYPRIVLYSVSWCPHCKEAKEYFTHNNIPFINKDVELDEQYLKELMETYRSTGVPVVVIGNDQKILKGFKPREFEKALREVRGP